MSYTSIMEMAGNQSLVARVAACAASLGIDTAVLWSQQNIWRVAGTEGWQQPWETAVAAHDINANPDTGVRNDVITDQMIYQAVHDLLVNSGLISP